MSSSSARSFARSLLLGLCLTIVLADWWHPKPKTTWQWQLSTPPIDTSYAVEMYDIDLFDAPQAVIDQLHAQGKKVICYYSAGSYENWRSDASSFPTSLLGNNLAGWAGERWLDVTKINELAPIMRARLDLAMAKKCDGVEPDNVDGYMQDSGFTISYSQQIAYNQWTSSEAHARNLSVGLKNDLSQIPDLLSVNDFAVNEECVSFNECGLLNPFVASNKAVFGCMYAQDPSTFCASSIASGFSFIKKNLQLDSSVTFCLPANFSAPLTPAPTTTLTTALLSSNTPTASVSSSTSSLSPSASSTTSSSAAAVVVSSSPSISPTAASSSPIVSPTAAPTISSTTSSQSESIPTQTTSTPNTSETPSSSPSSSAVGNETTIPQVNLEMHTNPTSSSNTNAKIVIIAVICVTIAIIASITGFVGYKLYKEKKTASSLPSSFRQSRQLQRIDEAELYATSPTVSTDSVKSTTNLV